MWNWTPPSSRPVGAFCPRRWICPSLHIVTTDARGFIRDTDERFEAVILDAPDPATTQINRWYTTEFFAEVKRVLAPGGGWYRWGWGVTRTS